MKKILHNLKRWWAKVTQSGTGGLVQSGDWRCNYPDGAKTRWLSYGDAEICRRFWGGTLEWRGDKTEEQRRFEEMVDGVRELLKLDLENDGATCDWLELQRALARVRSYLEVGK